MCHLRDVSLLSQEQPEVLREAEVVPMGMVWPDPRDI